MTNLDSILRSKSITLLKKVHTVKAMISKVVMYGCESWTIMKAEHQRIDAFKLWCWRRLLRVPLTARRSNYVNPKGNQPWLFIGKIDAEAETPILWHLMQTANSLEKILILRAEKVGNRGWDHWMASWTQWTWVWANSRRQWRIGKLDVLQSMGSQRVRTWVTEQQQKGWHSYFQNNIIISQIMTVRYSVLYVIILLGVTKEVNIRYSKYRKLSRILFLWPYICSYVETSIGIQ